MNEKIIEALSEQSGYACYIISRTPCTEVDSYGIHIGDLGNNPSTCATCGGDGFIETETVFYPVVSYVKGDERIVVETGILEKGDVIAKVKTGYALNDDDQIKIGSDYFKRVHKTIDSLDTFETWFLKRMVE